MNTQDSQSELDQIKDILADTLVYRSNKLDLHPLDIPELAESLQDYVTTRVKEAREPLVRILEKSDYGKCLECGEFYHDDDMVFCEPCEENGDNSAMHEWCAGTLYNGDGEYPAESAYALCKKHSSPLTTTTNGKGE